MNRPLYVKYSSPEFIAVVRRFRSKEVKPRGWFFLLQCGLASEHVKAAQYVGFETRLKLVKIELSKVIGEYMGETEKNLSAVLEQTGASRAVLFFDEADAIFGRRSDQKQAVETCQTFRQTIEEAKRIVILSNAGKEQIENSLLELIDVVVEFRSLK